MIGVLLTFWIFLFRVPYRIYPNLLFRVITSLPYITFLSLCNQKKPLLHILLKQLRVMKRKWTVTWGGGVKIDNAIDLDPFYPVSLSRLV